MKTLNSLALGLLAAGLTLTAGPGSAQAQVQDQPSPTRTVAVHYGDLDLGSQRGRAILGHRIRAAVDAACGTASSADLEGQNQAAACRRDLVAGLADQRAAAIAAARPTGTPATLIARR